MASTASFRLLRLDRSWIETLRAMRVHAVEDPFAPSPAVWLQWAFVGEQRGNLLRWLEAIELFVLLARANREAWRAAVLDLRRSSYYSFARAWNELVLEPRELPRVSGYEVVCSETDDAEHVCDFLASRVTQRNRTSPEYNHMRSILEAEMGAEAREIPVQLRYNPRRPWRSSIVGLLPQLAALAKSQMEHASEEESSCTTSSRKLRSRVTSVYNEISTFTRADESFLRLMVEIKTNGIDFVDLPQLNYASMPQKSVFLMTALQQLLGTRSSGHPGGVRRVFLTDKTPAPIAEALLSAVRESPSVHEVYFNFEEAVDEADIVERGRTLQWMAYALFSAEAQNQLSKITLRCRFLTPTHVAILQDVLTSNAPLEDLFPSNDACAARHARISTSRITLSNPDDENVVLSVLDDFELNDLIVLGANKDWWRALLPGWGQAWVRKGDAQLSAHHMPSASHKVRSNIRLELAQFDVQGVDSMLSFLCVIGSCVVKLRLLDRERALDSWCPDVFDACPNLEEFVLWEAVPDRLAVFVDSFTESRCLRLKKLFIGVELLTEAAHQEIIQLFHALSDAHHPMARRLDALEIDVFCTIEGNDIVDSNVLDVVLDMLDKNAHLSRLKLYLPLASTDMGAMHDISDALMMHHAVPIPSPVAPLGHREKAALLSVVWGNHEHLDPQTSAMAGFDQRILSTIIGFVPDRKIRLVHVAMPRPAELAQE